MKKTLSIVLMLVLCLGLLTLTGCGSKEMDIENPFADLDLAEYITLPDYDTYTTSEPVVEISDEDIEAGITERLEAAKTTEEVKEGTVEEGDTVTISFEGTLADGTTKDGMNSESTKITLGQAGMIDGFEEGLYGATIGEPVTLDLQFPDPYKNDEDLAGKDVTFVVTVLSKEVEVVPELDEEFIKANSDVTTEEEYRDYVKGELEKEEYDSQLENLKNELYTKIIEETEVLQYPEDRVTEQAENLKTQYQSMATNYGYEDWAEFLDSYFGMDEAEFDEQANLVAQSIVKQEMAIFAIAEKEGITLTEDEFNDYMDEMLEAAGFEDADTFETYAGMTIQEYAKAYNLDRDLLLTKELDTIYDRLEKK